MTAVFCLCCSFLSGITVVYEYDNLSSKFWQHKTYHAHVSWQIADIGKTMGNIVI